jgi:hypothetical protein
MKRIGVVLAAGIVLASCSKDENMNGGGVMIKGNIPANARKSTQFGANDGTGLADAKNVLILFGDQSKVSEISDNRFSVSVPSGNATALIFVDGSNRYIGNLFAGGMNILPLVNLVDSNETVIDLSSLSLDGTNVIPSDDPVGSEIQIGQQEIDMIKELGSYYESLAKNIDTDNDGIPDNFNGTQIIVNTGFSIEAGTWGLNETPASVPDSDQLVVRYGLRIKGWDNLVPPHLNYSFSGPEGDPYNDIVTGNYNYQENCGCFDIRFSRQSSNTDGESPEPPFKDGIYTFTMDGVNNHTIHYSSIGVEHFLVLAVPVLHTDGSNLVTSITIDFLLPDKTGVDYNAFISTLMIQIGCSNGSQYQTGRIFDLMNRLPDFRNVVLETPVLLDEIQWVNITYTDLVGNIYNLSWRRPGM